MAEIGERMAKVEGWIEGHEKLCAERYSGLNKTMVSVGDMVKNQNRVLLGIAGSIFLIGVGLIGWLGVQLWDRQSDRVDQIEARAGK